MSSCLLFQVWIYNEDHELILNNLLCLDVSETRSSDPPRLMKCHGSGGSQQWTFGVSGEAGTSRVINVSVRDSSTNRTSGLSLIVTKLQMYQGSCTITDRAHGSSSLYRNCTDFDGCISVLTTFVELWDMQALCNIERFLQLH